MLFRAKARHSASWRPCGGSELNRAVGWRFLSSEGPQSRGDGQIEGFAADDSDAPQRDFWSASTFVKRFFLPGLVLRYFYLCGRVQQAGVFPQLASIAQIDNSVAGLSARGGPLSVRSDAGD